jgi:hypothetical protein
MGEASGRGVTLTPHTLLVPRSENRIELYLYTPLKAFVACKKRETYLNRDNTHNISHSFSLRDTA